MALLFTILCGGAVIILGYFSYYFTRGHFIHGTEAVIDTEIKYLSQTQEPRTFPTAKDRIYITFDHDQQSELLSAPVDRLAEGIIVFDKKDSDRKYAAKIHTFPDGKKLLVGIDITEASQNYRFMLWLSIISIVFMAVVILFSFMISVFVVSGTNKIAETAKDIMNTGDLSQRLEVGSHWDDLSNMAAVLNMFLERIEQLMLGVRQVSDNIAHDLRTPLTRMRNHIEELKEQEPDKEEYEKLLTEADHLLSTFGALLRISRIEAEKQKQHFQSVDMSKLLNDVISFYEPLAEDKDITMTLNAEPASLHGDKDLLFQAYANIIDNAIKFTPKGGKISVNLEANCTVQITDNGPGVSEEELEKMFNRFYRGEESRSTRGTGLGLSLALAVITLHGGNITAHNKHPGLEIITTL